MKKQETMLRNLGFGLVLLGSLALVTSAALGGNKCSALGLRDKQARNAALQVALTAAIGVANGGLGNHMWGTLVDQDGVVCAVAFTGATRIDQWPGSRVISAQKANTAASFNLPAGVGGTVDALSTANLWTQTQPGGSLFGLQFSNPVDTAVAYGSSSSHSGFFSSTGEVANYGTRYDPMVDHLIGGINVFGGGLGLYDASGNKVGGIGVSGDTSCADHNIAWRTRNNLNLDFLTTAGVSGLTAAPRQDNIIYDIPAGMNHSAADTSASGFGHPDCGFGESGVSLLLPATQ